MKLSLTIATFFVTLMPILASAQTTYEGPQSCSCSAVYRNGAYQDYVRVECDDPFAGKCLEEKKVSDQWVWVVVNDSVCQAYEKQLGE